MSEKVKSWWSDDGQWFCLLVDDGVNKSTVSLTPQEASQLAAALRIPAQRTASPENETTEGYTEAEGYAASLRQQADLMEKANAGAVSAYVAIDDFDVDELRSAADFIERISAQQMTEPVAWRWRPKGTISTWIYNPEPQWLAEHRDEIDAEPLYAFTSPESQS